MIGVRYNNEQDLQSELPLFSEAVIIDLDIYSPNRFYYQGVGSVLSADQYKTKFLGLDRTLESDIELGRKVLFEYLSENKQMDITTEQSLMQLQKFAPIKSLLEVGAIGAARDLLFSIEVDDVFTQERKDKFLQLLA